jgi:lipoyl(octanoyl) transferase
VNPPASAHARTALAGLSVRELGLVAYNEAHALQKQTAEAVASGLAPNTLFLLQHPHTYTLGSRATRDNILWSEEECARRGITILATDRGGDVTYHGPGQLVGYPILRLPANPSADVVGYVRQLEQVLILALAAFGLAAQRNEGFTGVWLPTAGGSLAKVAAIGVKVNSRGVTMHGFALNHNPDMTYFSGIVPCGIKDKPVVSLAQVLPQLPSWASLQTEIVGAFRQVISLA